MSRRRRPHESQYRQLPITTPERQLPQTHADPGTDTLYISSKRCLLGARVYPFGGIVLLAASAPDTARYRINAGSWNTISVGSYTDLFSAIKFVSDVVDEFGTFNYELEITLESTVVLTESVDLVVDIAIPVIAKYCYEDTPFRIFADTILAADPDEITAIQYSIAGDATVAKTAIPDQIKYSESHTGSNNSATLSVTDWDWTKISVDVGVDIVKNTTDGSEGVVSSVTASELSATLTGGSENLWDTGDDFEIVDGRDFAILARNFQYTFADSGYYVCTLYVTDSNSNETSISVFVTVSEVLQ